MEQDLDTMKTLATISLKEDLLTRFPYDEADDTIQIHDQPSWLDICNKLCPNSLHRGWHLIYSHKLSMKKHAPHQLEICCISTHHSHFLVTIKAWLGTCSTSQPTSSNEELQPELCSACILAYTHSVLLLEAGGRSSPVISRAELATPLPLDSSAVGSTMICDVKNIHGSTSRI